MNTHYRHTQVGWVILGFAAAVVALVWAGLPPEAAAAARGPCFSSPRSSCSSSAR